MTTQELLDVCAVAASWHTVAGQPPVKICLLLDFPRGQAVLFFAGPVSVASLRLLEPLSPEPLLALIDSAARQAMEDRPLPLVNTERMGQG